MAAERRIKAVFSKIAVASIALCVVQPARTQATAILPMPMPSWFDAAGNIVASAEVSHGRDESDDGQADSKNGTSVREKVEESISIWNKVEGAGDLARQCLDATHIVEMSERPGGISEVVYLLIVLCAAFAALLVTWILAKVFHVEIAKLLWIPMGLCLLGIGSAIAALKHSAKHKKFVAAGLFASAMGATTAVGAIRRNVIHLVAEAILHFSAWYVMILIVVLPLLGLLLLWKLLGNHAGGTLGTISSSVFRNALGLLLIPVSWAVVFLLVIEIASPWFDGKFAGTSASSFAPAAFQGGADGSPRHFSTLPVSLRVAALEMAEASEAAYGQKAPTGPEPLREWTPPPGFLFNDKTGCVETPSGTKALVFVRNADSGREIVIAFRGTADLKDGRTDYGQLIDDIPPAAYREAAELVASLSGTGERIVATGHSLGAGLAQYAVAMTAGKGDIRGIGFNPAGLSMSTLNDIERTTCSGAHAASRSFASIRTGNDPVSPIRTLLGPTYRLGGRSGFGLFGAGHSISSVIAAIKDTLN